MKALESDEPLSATEREELELLRRQVAELRRDWGERPPPARETGAGRMAGHRGLRWTAAGVLLVLVAVLAFSSVLARYARGEVLDTDRYVQTVTPLASDPVMQGELTNQITDQIMTRLDVETLTAEALTALSENAPRVPPAVVGLAPVLADQAQSFVRQTVGSFVASDQFEALWIRANREAHQVLVAVMTGQTRAAVQISDQGTVSIELAPIIDNVRTKLTERGFAFADKIPEIDKSFVLFQSPELVKAQRTVSALDRASTVLPLVTLLVAAAAVWAAPKGGRRRAFSLVGVSIAVAMALLAVAISIGRAIYLGEMPSDVLSRDAAAVLIDTLVLPLRTALRAVFLLAVVVAAAGYLTGSSNSAVAVRGAYNKAVNAVRGARSGGRAPSPVEAVVATYRTPLRVVLIAIATMTLVFWKYPSGLVVVVTVLITVVALLLVELVARPA
ncbi:MAG: hypothetical protein WAW17_16820, partial [Rhodococcus sp. (in: high G+C Gram-positive bacteria)]|uniref:hypothetical protein n=1 Tax=Rhodococcus sp. TaxID=1831 RepID=UPI003BB1917A